MGECVSWRGGSQEVARPATIAHKLGYLFVLLLIRKGLTRAFFLSEGTTLIGPSPIFLKHWQLPNKEAQTWFPPQNRSLVQYFLLFPRRSHIHWPITNIFGTLGTAQYRSLDIFPPQNRCIVLLPFGPHLQLIYMEVELWPNNAGSKLRCHWNVLGNTLGIWGTFWEPDYVRTWWDHIGGRPKKKNPPPPCMLSLLIGCMKFLFSKLFVTIST
jgi:hypothetical protein